MSEQAAIRSLCTREALLRVAAAACRFADLNSWYLPDYKSHEIQQRVCEALRDAGLWKEGEEA